MGGKRTKLADSSADVKRSIGPVSDAASKGRVVVERTCNDKGRKVGRACVIYVVAIKFQSGLPRPLGQATITRAKSALRLRQPTNVLGNG